MKSLLIVSGLMLLIVSGCADSSCTDSSCSGSDAAVTSTPSSAVASPTPYDYCGGTGTTAAPYLVCDETSFDSIGQNPNAQFSLENDIVLTTEGTPISSFSGKINGNSKTVSSLSLNSSWILNNSGTVENLNFSNVTLNFLSGTVVGLIGANTGIVTNIDLISGTVTAFAGNTSIGGVVGQNASTGTITNLFCGETLNTNSVTTSISAGGCVGTNSGTITSLAGGSTLSVRAQNSILSNSIMGGLVGANIGTGMITTATNLGNEVGGLILGGMVGENSGTIIHAINLSSVNSSVPGAYIGGIVGYNTLGTLAQVENDGNVTGTFNVGGVLGYQDNPGSSVLNAANIGTVTISSGATSTTSVGGFAGKIIAGTFTNVYSIGTVTGSATNSGSVIGSNAGTGSASFFITTTTAVGTGSSTGLTGLAVTAFGTQTSFPWNFTTVWTLNPSGFPVLR